MSDLPLIYVILGAPGSGRRELVRDLIQDGLDPSEPALVLVSSREGPGPDKGESGALEFGHWDWNEGKPQMTIPDGFKRIFWITEGHMSPVDQVEAFAQWLPKESLELARIITVVHARLASRHQELLRWYEACIHFSDVVLINRREEVPQKWINDFLDRFHKEHYPCHFEQVKAGKVRNPALILEPEPRRMSLLFDELPELEPGEGGGDEDVIPEGDPYFTRQRSGRREKQVPEIRDYLE
jgi:hypothetical protein